MTSLNPVFRIGKQIAEAVQLHQKVSGKEAWDRSIEMLRLVGISPCRKNESAIILTNSAAGCDSE